MLREQGGDRDKNCRDGTGTLGTVGDGDKLLSPCSSLFTPKNQTRRQGVLDRWSESVEQLIHVLMFELFMYVYSCNALSAQFFTLDRALNSYFMIMITIYCFPHPLDKLYVLFLLIFFIISLVSVLVLNCFFLNFDHGWYCKLPATLLLNA